MGKINIIIDDEVERKFRTKIAKEGGKKGDLSKTIEKLMGEYINDS